MVGLADIPCFGKLVDKASDNLVEKFLRGLNYLFCYKTLVDELEIETGKLKIEKEKMSRKIKEEEDNGKIIEDYVLTWQNNVEEEMQKKSTEELSPNCSCIQRLPIPNPFSRFKIGRNAAYKASMVTKFTDTGKEYLNGEIAHLAPAKKSVPKSVTTFKEFQSREDTYGKLRDGLVNKDSPLVHGIYGMPGVGKTHTMEKLCEDVIKEKTFDKVVRVNVGNENLDKSKLQDKFAGRLNCHLESQDVEHRASQLEQSLRNGGKILLVLDDVWTEIPLDDIIGTPFGDGSSSKDSKILLTSREKNACLKNNCEHPVEVKTLSPDEALYLFKNAVGPDTISSVLDESLVQKVCAECGCLPLLIHAVGKALKGKSPHSWEDAHNQLKKGKFEKIVGIDRQVYVGIKLSIDHLEDEEEKSCLFLCSMFPEDADIDMKILTVLATGSQLIPDEESRILTLVENLKTSSLLLDSGYNHDTKIHDIIRDVARSMASADSKHAFLQVTCNSGCLPRNANYPSLKFLRLDAETADVHFMENLECPDLCTLWLQSNNHPQNFSGGFFRMFMNLSSLMLQNVKISLEQFSLQPLGNLQTLSFINCDICKTDVSLFPEKLRTLWIYDCDLPIRMDVANLKYLQKLEIQVEQGQPELVMMSDVMSTLSSLEELHIPKGFISEYDMDPIVMEISRLTNLTSLNFCFKNGNTFDEGTDIFSNVKRYDIFVGQSGMSEYRHNSVPSGRSIELYGTHWQSWEGLMARAEKLRLYFSDLEVIGSICNRHRRAFEDLKTLHIENCYNMGYLASISQDEINYSLQQATCFSKLTSLEIYSCPALKYLFCNNIAKSLVHLQELGVGECGSLEAIILDDGTTDGEIINFHKLKTLKMFDMQGLRSFYAEKNNMYSSSALLVDNSAHQSLFDGRVAFPCLEELLITRLPNTTVIWGKEYFKSDILSSFCKINHLNVNGCDKLEIVIPQAMLHRLNNLESIEVYDCSSLRTMFPPSVASDLTHLKEMRVSECGEIREIIEAGEQVITDDGILFPELTDLELDDLPSLTTFWCYQSGKHNTCKVAFRLLRLSSIALKYLPALKSFFHGANFEFYMPALKQVAVQNCGISTLFTFSMFRNFQLKKLKVISCELLENIVEDLRGDEICDKIITLSQLTTVNLSKLPNLKSFFQNANYEFQMPVIEEVILHHCGISDSLFRRSVFRNLKQLKKLEVSDCSLLEGIIEDVRVHETSDLSDRIITFSQLSSLHLKNLPNLKKFVCSANYECKMPALTEVKVVNCGIFTLFTCSVFQELQQLKNLEIIDCSFLESIVENVGGDEISITNGTLFPELTSLNLVRLPSLTSFWRYQSGKANTSKVALTLLRLSSITLEHLPSLKSCFHGDNLEFHMPVIKKLKVNDCGLYTTLFTRSVFRNLRQLEVLSVVDCKLLEGIFEDTRGDENTSDKIITLNRVSTVYLQGLPKCKSIFHGANYECYMPVLKTVTIVGFGLSSLVSFSVFREIQQLEELFVSDCESLEHIVEEVRVDETSSIKGQSINSPELSSVTLASLPNLKSFSCSPAYVFNMPKLQKLELWECPQIDYFNSSKTNTPAVRVTIDGCSKEGIQDLNDYIRQKYRRGSYSSDCAEEEKSQET